MTVFFVLEIASGEEEEFVVVAAEKCVEDMAVVHRRLKFWRQSYKKETEM